MTFEREFAIKRRKIVPQYEELMWVNGSKEWVVGGQTICRGPGL